MARRYPLGFALLLALAGSLLVQAVVLGAAAIRGLLLDRGFEGALYEVGLDPVTLGLAQALGFGVAIAFGLSRTSAAADEVLGLEPIRWRILLLAFGAGLSAQLPLTEIGNIARERWPLELSEQLRHAQLVGPAGWIAAFGGVFAFVLIAPIFEELLFRGLLLRFLIEGYGRGTGILLSSLLFGLIHVDPAVIITASMAGWLFAELRLRSGSIWPAIGLHAGINALPLLLPPRLLRIPGFNTVQPEVYHLPAALVIGSGLVMALALWRLLAAKETERR
ncbi:MAG: CPBP family intramembrane metalloprotease [Myxococcales bacterium]|nr:CPBP family intramembrane metalloprotease [Myxococcales bacterium]